MATPLSPEEKAYRRGFDQALFCTLYALGLEDKEIHDLPYKKRVVAWRYNHKKRERSERDIAPLMTPDEVEDLEYLLGKSSPIKGVMKPRA